MSQVYVDDRSIRNEFDRIDSTLKGKLRQEILRRTSIITLRFMKTTALPKITGTLRRSYLIVKKEDDHYIIDSNIGVGKRLHYADTVEFGTKGGTIKRRGRRFTLPPRKGQYNIRDKVVPFARKALIKNFESVIKGGV